MHRLLSDGMLSRHGSSVAQTASPSMDIQVRAVLPLLAFARGELLTTP